jgi:hypothetical protein
VQLRREEVPGMALGRLDAGEDGMKDGRERGEDKRMHVF